MTNDQQATPEVEVDSGKFPEEQLSWKRALVGFASSLIVVVLTPVILASF
jgi:hypothetical protein